MNIPDALKYTSDHEWVVLDGDVATIGITDFAQGELGDIVYVEMPEIGAALNTHDSCGVLEAVKTVADIYAPLAGSITEVNGNLSDTPDLINTDPYGDGWILKIRISDPAAYETLLSAEQYQAHVQ